MIEVISNRGVYVLDSKRRKNDGDLFRRRSLLIFVNYRIQAYARACDSDGPVLSKRQGQDNGCFQRSHARPLYTLSRRFTYPLSQVLHHL